MAFRPALIVKTPPQGSTGLQKERSSSSLLLMDARISSNNVLDLKRQTRMWVSRGSYRGSLNEDEV